MSRKSAIVNVLLLTELVTGGVEGMKSGDKVRVFSKLCDSI